MLREQRGRTTVPVLGIPEGGSSRLLAESRDIIAYLGAHAEQWRGA